MYCISPWGVYPCGLFLLLFLPIAAKYITLIPCYCWQQEVICDTDEGRWKALTVKVIEARETVKKKIRVAAYARVSTDHDEQENSLDNQIS